MTATRTPRPVCNRASCARRRAIPSLTLAIALAIGAAFTLAPDAHAQDKLRISLDTNPSHVRNKGVAQFADELKKRIGDKLVIEIYPSAQLFRDRDVLKALRQGGVEMAVPGIWQLDGVEPNIAIQTLPMFYGVGGDIVHTVMDGKLGQFLNQKMEQRMKVKIVGKWFDLGEQLIFGIQKPINSYDDLKGMKIRHSGGTANAARINGLGGTPMLVPFPDVPLAMSQGVIDGVATTYESAWSSKLHDSGLKYAFEDNQFFGQYVPMIAEAFWKKQPKDVQDAIVASWEIAANGQRAEAAKAQGDARMSLEKVGMKLAKPTPAQIVEKRRVLMSTQDDLVKQLKIDKDAIDTATEGLREAKVAF